MHPADITAALRKAGSSQAEIARRLKVSRTAVCSVVANRPANRSKRIARAISRQIGIPVDSIWPGTYSSTTTRRRPRRSA